MTTNPLRKTKKKGRANGDWKRIAASRQAAHGNRETVRTVGLSASAPALSAVGSAAYRRSLARRGRRSA
jgi:hypothetical protein